MTAWLRLIALLTVATALAACAGTSRTTFPPLGWIPAPVGDATAATKTSVTGALAAVGLQAVDAIRPYRPPEGALLAAAPRSVLEVTLPDDPRQAFVVIYAFPTEAAVQAAATDHATYVSSGPGRIQYSLDSHFVLRIVGSTVVFFTWSPATSPDARTKLIEDALGTLGTAVPIPG